MTFTTQLITIVAIAAATAGVAFPYMVDRDPLDRLSMALHIGLTVFVVGSIGIYSLLDAPPDDFNSLLQVAGVAAVASFLIQGYHTHRHRQLLQQPPPPPAEEENPSEEEEEASTDY